MHTGFGLVVRFTLREGSEDAFDALTAKTLEGIRAAEPGTTLYVTHRVPDEPRVRVFYELYEEQAAFAVHEQQPHVQHFLSERERYVDRTEVTFLAAVDGKVQ
ncbi:antibiotic biosynthesis monooxygenase [Streptomyces sp. B-S-A8]|uniref:Antibiotic biosynthesis monooxygenase n=1 Tax=Streptomyces solicavernae TaxID=3043614 RepID=A0ABT6RPE7_9ACTN|nr:antibiotic biosynthesis monooxygenase [Streptomyces sp. B-S-A8]MDI3385586.1 antibiotic biosynthesis monooxygenase [Streptomyces sp. B-S-A8]